MGVTTQCPNGSKTKCRKMTLRNTTCLVVYIFVYGSITLADVQIGLHRYGRTQFGTQDEYEKMVRAASQHVNTCRAKFGESHAKTSESLLTLAEVYEAWGRFVEAEATYERVLAIEEHINPPNHPDVATTLLRLSRILRHQRRYSEAEMLLRRCLQMLEGNPLADEVHLSVCFSDLAGVYSDQQEYEKAEPLYLRTMALLETTAPPLVQATAVHNLGMLYLNMGRYADAMSSLESALTIMEEQMGPDSPQLATVSENLAALYFLERRLREASDLYEQCLKGQETLHGLNHPALITSLCGLSLCYYEQGRIAQGEALAKRAQSIAAGKLDENDGKAAHVFRQLSKGLRHRGRYETSKRLLELAVSILQKARGVDDPVVAEMLVELGEIHYQQRQLDEAKRLYLLAWAIAEKGKVSPVLNAAILHSLSTIHGSQGDSDEAERFATLAVDFTKTHLGGEHPFHVVAVSDLAHALRSKGRMDDAGKLYARAVSICEERGEPFKQYARALSNLASYKTGIGEYVEAESIYIRELALWREHGWDESPERARSLFELAFLHARDGRYDSAERLCVVAFTLSKDLLGLEHPDILRILDALRILYREKGNENQVRRINALKESIREDMAPEDPQEIAFFINDLATGQYDILEINNAAERILLTSLIIERDGIGDDPQKVAQILLDLGRLCHDEARLADAETWYKEALSTYKQFGEKDFDEEEILKSMIDLYRDMGLSQKAHATERQLSSLNTNFDFSVRPSSSVDAVEAIGSDH